MQNCEFNLNFVSFEAFESQKADDCLMLYLAPFFRVGLPKPKCRIMTRRPHQYGGIVSPVSMREKQGVRSRSH
jgi:hypothetical protein